MQLVADIMTARRLKHIQREGLTITYTDATPIVRGKIPPKRYLRVGGARFSTRLTPVDRRGAGSEIHDRANGPAVSSTVAYPLAVSFAAVGISATVNPTNLRAPDVTYQIHCCLCKVAPHCMQVPGERHMTSRSDPFEWNMSLQAENVSGIVAILRCKRGVITEARSAHRVNF